MSNFTVTVNGNAVSYTTYNPLTGSTPTINDFSWYYYLVNGSSSTQTVTIQQDGHQTSAGIYVCLIGPGGNGGALGTNDGDPGGGAYGVGLSGYVGNVGAQYYGAQWEGAQYRSYSTITFEDGTSCDMNYSGYGGYNQNTEGGNIDTTGVGTAGSIAKFMLYFSQ